MCTDDRDWIDPETGEFYIGLNTCDIKKITSKNKSKFKDRVIVLDDMGDKLNKDIAYYFTEGRHYNIQMIVMCHEPAQIFNTARMSCDTFYLTTYNGADLFKNFDEIYKADGFRLASTILGIIGTCFMIYYYMSPDTTVKLLEMWQRVEVIY